MTYAATGAGCTGVVGTSAVLAADEAPLPLTSHAIPQPSFVAATPVRHGPWLLHPLGWTDRSIFEEQRTVPAPTSRCWAPRRATLTIFFCPRSLY